MWNIAQELSVIVIYLIIKSKYFNFRYTDCQRWQEKNNLKSETRYCKYIEKVE